MEESKVSVTLKQRERVGGVWHEAGQTVEVYQQEAYGMAKRGVIDAVLDHGFLNVEAATDLSNDREKQRENRAQTEARYAEKARQAVAGNAAASQEKPGCSRPKTDGE